METKMNETLIALQEAKRILNNLLAQYPVGNTTRRYELNNDLNRIKQQITLIEKFLDPFTVAELEEMEVQND